MIKCYECKVWIEVNVGLHKGHKTGECRRKSATLSPKGTGVWPITRDIDGCFDGINKMESLNE